MFWLIFLIEYIFGYAFSELLLHCRKHHQRESQC